MGSVTISYNMLIIFLLYQLMIINYNISYYITYYVYYYHIISDYAHRCNAAHS